MAQEGHPKGVARRIADWRMTPFGSSVLQAPLIDLTELTSAEIADTKKALSAIIPTRGREYECLRQCDEA